MAEECQTHKRLDIIVQPGCPIFLMNLPVWEGFRPRTNPCLPNAQLEDVSSENVFKEFYDQVFHVKKFAGCVGTKRSLVSLADTVALFLDENEPCQHAMIGNEWAHIHGPGGGNGSLHLLLSDADASTLIEKGWSELHFLAGKSFIMSNRPLKLPSGMVYAPRNRDKISIVHDKLTASYKYSLGDFIPSAFSA